MTEIERAVARIKADQRRHKPRPCMCGVTPDVAGLTDGPWIVECPECGCCVPRKNDQAKFATRKEVVAAWNELMKEWEADDLAGIPRCRICGCTDDHACPGGCYWVEDPEGMGDLCSRCADELTRGTP